MTQETRDRISARLKRFYSDPENLARARKRMSSDVVRKRIAEGTRKGLAARGRDE